MPVTITPLSGTNASAGYALAYLLEIEDARVLLDCGSYEGGVLQDVTPEQAQRRKDEEAHLIEQLRECVGAVNAATER